MIEHDGGPCPVAPNAVVEPMIETPDGIVSGGVTTADDHSPDAWNWRKSGMKSGRVVAYRETGRVKMSRIDEFIA